ncbi:hypothetical protein LTR37_019321 [Vermiconidia calcicola]|uniref:Uncharacterized protein n=1 Tax=Vermiconidia calcicola TaxID=1690605 RepID=A0ACC3MEG2_9PEZI|nr:hypothetical protein LTR37_019321 [Vermiconidia calcicola]
MSSDQHQQAPAAMDFPWPPSNGIYGTYDLHCHCGAIRYTMKISPPLYEEHTQGKEQYVADECDCSHCERQGYVSVHPLSKDVEFTQGLEDRMEYYCGAKNNPHWFCRKCGSVVGSDLTHLMTEVLGMENRMTVNVRMLKDYDPDKLMTRKMKFMKNMPPKYEV